MLVSVPLSGLVSVNVYAGVGMAVMKAAKEVSVPLSGLVSVN